MYVLFIERYKSCTDVLIYFVYLVMYTGLNDMEMKREADSNDITECSNDDKPSVGMFVVFSILSTYFSTY